VWGGADFAGGLSARKHNSFQVLVTAGIGGTAVLLPIALLLGEPLLDAAGCAWATLAGICGAIGTTTLYYALAQGNAAAVSPPAAVIGITLPVLISAWVEGMPGPARLAGICLGVVGIWLVSQVQREARPGSLERGEPRPTPRRDLRLALLSGVGFAGFFIFMGQLPEGALFFPSAVAKFVSVLTGLVILLTRRQALWAGPDKLALSVGVMDVSGNVTYLIARHLTRLDVAVVLSSMYPAVTVILARVIQRQSVSRQQWAGILVCLVSVALIAI
jgi:drug/metabolite transporter (DMT)-like permease